MTRQTFEKTCKRCGKPFLADSKYKGKVFCSETCYRGRRWLRTDGYMGINVNGRATVEHRAIWEKAFGPINDRMQVVHHKNGVKTDNRIENLELIEVGEHSRMHNLRDGRRPILNAEARAKISAARRASKGKKRKRCTAEGCTEYAHGNGLCNKHYLRQRKHGDPLATLTNYPHSRQARSANLS